MTIALVNLSRNVPASNIRIQPPENAEKTYFQGKDAAICEW
jgi:hypothetical protein